MKIIKLFNKKIKYMILLILILIFKFEIFEYIL